MHTVVTQCTLLLAQSLADQMIVPLNVTDYAKVILSASATLIAGIDAQLVPALQNSILSMQSIAARFSSACTAFETLVDDALRHGAPVV
jgi:hypothetical protein